MSNPNENLVAHYKLDEKTGTVIIDSISGNNGTSPRNIALMQTTGKIGGALNFNGTSDYIDTGNTFTDIFKSSFTVSLWVKPSTIELELMQGIFGSGNTEDGDILILLMNNGSLFFEFYDGTGGANQIELDTLSEGDVAYFTNTTDWVFVTIVVDDENNHIKFFRNGGLVWQPEISPFSLAQHDLIDNIQIGRVYSADTGEGWDKFAGSLDDVRIFNKALSAPEVQYLFRLANNYKRSIYGGIERSIYGGRFITEKSIYGGK